MNVKENFTRVGKLIAVTLLLLLAGVSSWAQGRVTGKVIDVNGQPFFLNNFSIFVFRARLLNN